MPFTCPCCGRTSHNPHDTEQGYCGACHWFTGDTGDPELAAQHDPETCPARADSEAAAEAVARAWIFGD